MTPFADIAVILVHFHSGGMLLACLDDLSRQDGASMSSVIVVECGDDGSVGQAIARWPELKILTPGGNLGYCGGNNLALSTLSPGQAALIVNPDVRLHDPTTTRRLSAALAADPMLGAVAPLIRTHTGSIEYLESVIDLDTAVAEHRETSLPSLPPGTPDLVHLPWVNGACWLLGSEALAQVGTLDERYFLFFEEVDWALRAAAIGYKLALLTTTEVGHTRSASFGTSTKGAYYFWRNRYRLAADHATDRHWRRHWGRDLLAFVLRRRNVCSGGSANALLGGFDALRGRTGARPGKA